MCNAFEKFFLRRIGAQLKEDAYIGERRIESRETNSSDIDPKLSLILSIYSIGPHGSDFRLLPRCSSSLTSSVKRKIGADMKVKTILWLHST